MPEKMGPGMSEDGSGIALLAETGNRDYCSWLVGRLGVKFWLGRCGSLFDPHQPSPAWVFVLCEADDNQKQRWADG